MGKDLQKLAEKIAEAARKGVAVERLWQQQLGAELKQKQAKGSKEPADAKAILLDNSSRTSIGSAQTGDGSVMLFEPVPQWARFLRDRDHTAQ